MNDRPRSPSDPSLHDTPDLQAGYLAAGGARLFFESAGPEGGAALVLIHAGIADHTMWDDHLPVFARRRRVLRYDLRGFGKSTTAAVSFGHGEDLLELLDHLDLERAALLGISYGGRAALHAALLAPERIEALVLVSPSLTGLDYVPTETELALLERDEALGATGDWAGMADNDVALWVDGPGQMPGRAPARVRGRVRAMALGGYLDYTRRYPRPEDEPRPRPVEPPLIERLSELTAPLLIVEGALDTGMTRAAADRLASAIPGARRVTVPDTAHMLPLEEPERFVDLVEDFLDECGM